MSDNNTRRKILDTMFELVAQKGYDKASIGQIADIIGIKKASVYYYFKSKEEIFIELVRELYTDDSADSILLDAFTDKDIFKAAMIDYGNALIDSYADNSNLRKVYAEIDLQSTRIPALVEITEQLNKNMYNFLNKCLLQAAEHSIFIAGFDADVNAQMLLAVLVGIDDAILYGLPIEPKAVWLMAVSKLF